MRKLPHEWARDLVDRPRGIATLLVPINCVSCHVAKRNADGQLLYVDAQWLKGKRMICPTCHEGEKTMEAMREVVDSDWEELPF